MHRLFLALPLALLIAPPPVAAATTLNVTLVVGSDVADALDLDPAALAALPGHASCTLSLAPGSTGEDALDAAVADGCIASYTCDEFGFDCFVSEVDGLAAQGLTCLAWPAACQWWELYVHDGQQPAATGVRGHVVHDGEVLRIEFHTTCAELACP